MHPWLNDTQQQPPTYSLAERDRRWALARQLMDAEGVDALLICGDREGTGPAPFAPDTYFTNDRPGALVIFPRSGEPVALYDIPEMAIDHLQARRHQEAVWVQPENLRVGRFPADIVVALRDYGLSQARLGVLGLDPYPPFYFTGALPHGIWQAITSQLPQVTLTSVWRRFYMLTVGQSEEELAVLAWAARAGERMVQAVLNATHAGAMESDLYAAAMQAAFGSGVASPGMLLLTGADPVGWGPPAWTYRPQVPRCIQEGEVVLGEIFTTFGMREAQHQLAIAVGHLHPEHERATDVVRRSYETGLSFLRPGHTFGEVVKAMEQPLREAGAWNIRPLIHGMNPFSSIGGFLGGLERIPGTERYAHLGFIPLVLGELELRPGMTFAVEPNCGFGTFEMTVGTTVVVGEDDPIELGTLTTRLLRV
jgi:Xaa-Pro aminopeptidase